MWAKSHHRATKRQNGWHLSRRSEDKRENTCMPGITEYRAQGLWCDAFEGAAINRAHFWTAYWEGQFKSGLSRASISYIPLDGTIHHANGQLSNAVFLTAFISGMYDDYFFMN